MVGGSGAEDGARSPHPPRNSTLPLGVPSPMHIDKKGCEEHMPNKKTKTGIREEKKEALDNALYCQSSLCDIALRYHACFDW